MYRLIIAVFSVLLIAALILLSRSDPSGDFSKPPPNSNPDSTGNSEPPPGENSDRLASDTSELYFEETSESPPDQTDTKRSVKQDVIPITPIEDNSGTSGADVLVNWASVFVADRERFRDYIENSIAEDDRDSPIVLANTQTISDVIDSMDPKQDLDYLVECGAEVCYVDVWSKYSLFRDFETSFTATWEPTDDFYADRTSWEKTDKEEYRIYLY